MKQPLRFLIRVVVGLVAILGIVAFLAVDGVDHRPYLREPYYAETVSRLRALTATNPVVQGELSAGFGRARLTPTVNAPVDDPIQGRFRSLPLAGYGNRHGKPASGVHDDLYIKAAAMRVEGRVGVMVGVDALIVPPEVAEAASKQLALELKLSREQIYFSATHTHSGPGGWGEGPVARPSQAAFNPASASGLPIVSWPPSETPSTI